MPFSLTSISSVAKWPFVRINDYMKIIRERVSEKRDTQLVWIVLGQKQVSFWHCHSPFFDVTKA